MVQKSNFYTDFKLADGERSPRATHPRLVTGPEPRPCPSPIKPLNNLIFLWNYSRELENTLCIQ